MDWSGNEMIFNTQPSYVGNFFEILHPTDETGTFTDILEYVHAVDYNMHFCYVITIPYTTRRAFLDYKANQPVGTSPTVKAFIHFANYYLENICASIDGTNHDCTHH